MIRAVGRLAQAKTRLARVQPRLLSLLGVAVLLIVSTACNSTNEYPIDFFSEMHYSASWHAEEPPRLDSPTNAIQVNQQVMNSLAYGPLVQVGSAEPANYTLDEAKAAKNPLQATDANLKAGAELFAINCTQCHGQAGLGEDTPTDKIAKGNAFMLNYFNSVNQALKPGEQKLVLPKDLTKDPVASYTDGEIYYYLSNGIEKMPPFAGILTPEQRWQLILHIRQLEGK
jgi:mono/diheme cytochrome c family protein